MFQLCSYSYLLISVTVAGSLFPIVSSCPTPENFTIPSNPTCEEKYSCRGHCGQLNVACSCTADCTKYEDCCPDVDEQCLNMQLELVAPDFAFDCTSDVAVERWCSKPLHPHAKLCVNSTRSWNTESDILKNVPVTSSTSGRHYANLYCALCNEEDRTDLLAWNTEVQVPTDMAEIAAQLSNVQTMLDYLRRGSIELMITPPDKISSRKCFSQPLENSCPENCNGLLGLCKKHRGPILSYKNVYCASCNGMFRMFMELPDSCSSVAREDVRPSPPGISVLFTLSLGGRGIEVQNTIYDGDNAYVETLQLDLRANRSDLADLTKNLDALLAFVVRKLENDDMIVAHIDNSLRLVRVTNQALPSYCLTTDLSRLLIPSNDTYDKNITIFIRLYTVTPLEELLFTIKEEAETKESISFPRYFATFELLRIQPPFTSIPSLCGCVGSCSKETPPVLNCSNGQSTLKTTSVDTNDEFILIRVGELQHNLSLSDVIIVDNSTVIVCNDTLQVLRQNHETQSAEDNCNAPDYYSSLVLLPLSSVCLTIALVLQVKLRQSPLLVIEIQRIIITIVLLVYFTSFFIIILILGTDGSLHLARFLVYISYVSRIAVFFCYNALAITLARSLMAFTSHSAVETNSSIRFIAHAFIGPFLFLILALILDFGVADSTFAPLLGATNGWIQSSVRPQLLFFFVPVGILVLLNVCLCLAAIISVFRSLRARKRTLQRSTSRWHELKIYAALFVLTGAGWLVMLIKIALPFHCAVNLCTTLLLGCEGIWFGVFAIATSVREKKRNQASSSRSEQYRRQAQAAASSTNTANSVLRSDDSFKQNSTSESKEMYLDGLKTTDANRRAIPVEIRRM